MERVELAIHTYHSKLKGIGHPHEYVKFAMNNNMNCLAVTDTGTITAFPEFEETSKRMEDFKVIYGMDALIVDDRGENESSEYKRQPDIHISILIKNEIGRFNLYKLMSEAELKYGTGPSGVNRLPLTSLLSHHDGLLYGSGREDGLLRHILERTKWDTGHPEICDLKQLFDYIEIEAGLEEGRVWKLIDIAESFDIPAVAEAAPFYIDASDALCHKILTYDKTSIDKLGIDKTGIDKTGINKTGINKTGINEENVFYSTRYMLNHFEYLGADLAEQIVSINTNKIADMCSLKDLFIGQYKLQSSINDEKELRDICYNRLAKLYEEVPKKAKERLEWELEAVNKTRQACFFLNIRRMMEKYHIKPYEVGSRGMIGSSFVAYLCGITEINSYEQNLTPYFFFGIDGNKEVDIDLNLRPDVQQLFITKYRELPGIKDTVICGTIGNISSKRAMDMIYKYEDDTLQTFSATTRMNLEERLTYCQSSRGRHPGGILVIPEETDIYDYMPLKNIGDPDCPMMTSWFEFYTLGNIFSKLDFLGHDTPEMLYQLEALTGKDPCEISTEDEEIMATFKLGEDGYPACFGVPEFASDYIVNMLNMAEPENFDDLVKLCCLSHGTEVWLDNAEELIGSGVASIKEVLGSREDVYDTLIDYGIEERMAYTIAENVRKGKISAGKCKQWPDMKELLYDHDVPGWIINSFEKIRYMFPRSHSFAYMLGSWRLAWYKLHYPLEFYKILVDVRYDGVDIEKVVAAIIKDLGNADGIINNSLDIDVYEEDEIESLHNRIFERGAYLVLKKFISDGYAIELKEVQGPGKHLCEIGPDGNTLIIPVHR